MFRDAVTLRSGLPAAQVVIGDYLADFHQGGRDLVVTFESGAQTINRQDRLRDPWCFSFLVHRGFSVLGIKAPGRTCYRGKRFLRWFGSDETRGFLGGFDRCIFTGGSMGGLAALSFSSVRPGALIIAFNPLSTMNPATVGWDRRFPEGFREDWSGGFADAAETAPLARRVYLIYDPLNAPDKRHVDRIAGPNTVHLQVPSVGHGTPAALTKLGIFMDVADKMLDESLTPADFTKMLNTARARQVARQARRQMVGAVGIEPTTS